jgi:XTP/dITP diphosphohydrolase
MKLYAATSNRGKLAEFLNAAPDGIDIVGVRGLEPPKETGETFEENARLKAVYYSERVEGLVFAEDSGLEVEALGGAPGVYSARFAGPHPTDAENNRKLVASLEGIDNRRARYVCVVALAAKGEVLATFRGEVAGEIVDDARGTGGFGYDPHFYYAPFRATFAEVPLTRKLQVSHRNRAAHQLFAWLKNRFQVR